MAGEARFPTGTVTFLFTDIEGSTKLLQELGDRYEPALDEHRKLLREAFDAHSGREVGTEGDSFFVAFERATDAVRAALAGQLALATHAWLDEPIRVRMGVHTGEAKLTDDDYVGLAVHQAARVKEAAHGGQVLVSQTTKELAQEALPDEASLVDLGEHRLKDLAEPLQLYNLAHPQLRAELPPPRTLSVLPNNLPLQLTSFVGREHELGEVAKRFEESRLVTLAGAGGSGKTRLALQFAAEELTNHRDGVWCVELAAITDGALVPSAIAAALGIREQADGQGGVVPLLQTITEALALQRVMLILDNCEHVIDNAARVTSELLHRCPDVRVLATSRETLGVESEAVYRVPSLGAPAPDALPDEINASDAVRLFIDRGRLTRPSFDPNENELRSIARVCARLDGIPLAIELAASLVKVLASEQIDARLDDRFRLLTGGSRTAVERQRTLRAAVDWSHELLTESEAMVFRRLSVFSGGFTLEAAEAVCGFPPIDRLEVFAQLAALVEKSLVVTEDTGGDLRYQLNETMRQYGQEKLFEAEEGDLARSRHLAYFLNLAARMWDGLMGPEGRAWRRIAGAERDNVRAAVEWSLALDDVAAVLALAVSYADGGDLLFAERRSWLDWGLPKDEVVDPATRVRARITRSGLANAMSEFDLQREFARDAEKLARSGDDPRLVVEALLAVGASVGFGDDDYEGSRVVLEEALSIARDLRDEALMGRVLAMLASVATFNRSRYGIHDHPARTWFDEADALLRRECDEVTLMTCLWFQGMEARSRSDFEAARAVLDESIELARIWDAPFYEGWVLHELASVLCAVGDVRAARVAARRARALARRIGARTLAAFCAIECGEHALALGDIPDARESFNEVITISQSVDNASWTSSGLWGLARCALWEGEFDGALALLDEAEGYVLEEEAVMPAHRVFLEGLRGRVTLADSRPSDAIPILERAVEAARTGAPAALPQLLLRLALARRLAGAPDALPAAEEALDLLRDRADPVTAVFACDMLVVLCAPAEGTAEFAGFSRRMRENMGTPMIPVDVPRYEKALAEISSHLGADSYAAALERGCEMSAQDVMTAARGHVAAEGAKTQVETNLET